jgi:hypothetical protein
MMKKASVLAACAALLLAAGCASQKEPATKAIADAEAALAGFRDDAAKYLPDDLQSVEGTIASLKDNLQKGDYKAILAAAPELTSKLNALKDAAASKKAEMEAAIEKAKSDWTGFAADLPNMVSAIQSRVDILSKSKKLPKNLDAASFDAAKSGLATMKSTWDEAMAAFGSGNALDAAAKAQQVKDKGNEVMQLLGMTSG